MPRSIGTYRVFTRQFREAILGYPERRPLYGPLMLYMGFTAAFVPVRAAAAAEGTEQLHVRQALGLAVETLVSYTNVPHRILLFLGTALASDERAVPRGSRRRLLRPRALRFATGITLLLGVTLFLMGAVLAGPRDRRFYVFRVFQEVLGAAALPAGRSFRRRPTGPTRIGGVRGPRGRRAVRPTSAELGQMTQDPKGHASASPCTPRNAGDGRARASASPSHSPRPARRSPRRHPRPS